MTTHNLTTSRIEGIYARISNDISIASQGNRNVTLSKSAYTIGGYIPSGLIDYNTARDFLLSCVNSNSEYTAYDSNNWLSTIERSLKKGMEKPFDIDTDGKTFKPNCKPRPQASIPKPRKLNPQRPPVFSFNDAMDIIDNPYALEERSAILEFEAGFNRHDSEQLALKMHKLCNLQTRLFTLCVNLKCRNKERTPYAKDYEPAVLTIDGIKNIIKRGYSFTPALFAPEPEKNSRAYRDRKHWLQSELIVLDIDSGYKAVDDILNKANSVNGFLFAYTTPSHTPENPRMRLIYHLDYIETDFILYNRAVKILSSKLLADIADNACHSYYGNTEAIFYNGGE